MWCIDVGSGRSFVLDCVNLREVVGGGLSNETYTSNTWEGGGVTAKMSILGRGGVIKLGHRVKIKGN